MPGMQFWDYDYDAVREILGLKQLTCAWNYLTMSKLYVELWDYNESTSR